VGTLGIGHTEHVDAQIGADHGGAGFRKRKAKAAGSRRDIENTVPATERKPRSEHGDLEVREQAPFRGVVPLLVVEERFAVIVDPNGCINHARLRI
jgi:hypothetical protein